jgi:LPXTG-motif cell wall-anchored protein
MDSTNEVKYYGKLAQAMAGGGPASISIPADMPVGSYTIRMFNEEINGDHYTDFACTPIDIQLTVNAAPAVPVTSIAVTGAGSATAITTNGGTLQMLASVLPNNATDPSVTWSVTPGTGSATISTTGLLTAAGNGTVTVIATANDGSGVIGTFVITISGQTVAPPTVISVNPTGTGAPVSGNVVITFSEPMRTTPGVVQLNPVLSGGTWSAGNTVFTIPYSGLAGSTTYRVNISGFASTAGTVMSPNPDTRFSFTTVARPQSALPKTGDGFPLWQLLAGMGVALMGMGILGYRMREKRTKA